MGGNRTWMENYPKRSVKDMIGYCEYAMDEEKDNRVKYNGGHSQRYKMANEMRLILADILVRQKRGKHGQKRTR